MRFVLQLLVLATLLGGIGPLSAQSSSSSANLPRVIIPTYRQGVPSTPPLSSESRRLYPWRQNITATVFWIGDHKQGTNPGVKLSEPQSIRTPPQRGSSTHTQPKNLTSEPRL